MNDHTHRHSHSSQEHRTAALESLLVEKGILTSEQIDRYIEWIERDIGPMHGARAVARAWTVEEYKTTLLLDGRAALLQLGLDIPTQIVVVENTDAVHNVVCCTLCSCYPWTVLGLPPTWYKSPAYRSRIVIDPRSVLAEFGLTIPDDVEVRVWDSTSEVRYMVLPQRPPNTEDMDEKTLAALVTRDAMVGVARVETPCSS
ncbi:MAG: nitrile hydratase subunit alpha [Chloroflexota bacterium]